MELKIGEKIRSLRKERGLSQETLAQNLGVTFQAVSKWENGSALPDTALIPSIALFFGVSTDQLFEISLIETEKQVSAICNEAAGCRETDPAKSEGLLREGLKRYPGNDRLLNNLLYTLRAPERGGEVISLCHRLIETTQDDAIKYDAYRILAETYKARGEYGLAKSSLDRIPEIYFTKLQMQALLLEGEDMYAPACEQKDLAAEMLVDMLLRLADYHQGKGCPEKAKRRLLVCARVIEALAEEEPEEGRDRTFYEYYGKGILKEIQNR